MVDRRRARLESLRLRNADESSFADFPNRNVGLPIGDLNAVLGEGVVGFGVTSGHFTKSARCPRYPESGH